MIRRHRVPCLLGFSVLCVAAPGLVFAGGDPETNPAVESGSVPGEQGAAGDLPSIAAIGGAQDLWPFEFGLDADRDAVRRSLGEPQTTESIRPGPEAPEVTVISWHYSGLTVTFYSNNDTQLEYLLSVRVSSQDVALRSGIRIGMPTQEAIALLGEPEVDNGEVLVFFYYSTTIELVVADQTVREVAMSRALP